MTTTLMQCPRCGSTGSPEDRFCENDGTRLVPADLAGSVPGLPATCPCGLMQDDGDGYCAGCGHRLDQMRVALGPDPALDPDLALGAATDRGLHHPTNQDAVAVGFADTAHGRAAILVVCDGVSSARYAEEAASAAAVAARAVLVDFAQAGADEGQAGEELTTRPASDAEEAMREAIGAAHRAVCALADTPARETERDDLDPPGTTIVAAILRGGDLTVGWVGDSRAYWLANDELRPLTRDHSWANEQVTRGVLTVDEALRAPDAHALTQCLGPLEQAESASGGEPVPGIARLRPAPGGLLLLCSDGLWNYAPDPAQLGALLGVQPPDARATTTARALVAYAIGRGGRDNITAAIYRY